VSWRGQCSPSQQLPDDPEAIPDKVVVQAFRWQDRLRRPEVVSAVHCVPIDIVDKVLPKLVIAGCSVSVNIDGWALAFSRFCAVKAGRAGQRSKRSEAIRFRNFVSRPQIA
jgi:hypothetical protein